MQRYHKKVYFPESNELEQLNNDLNNLNFGYSRHCLENLKYRVVDMEDLLLYIAQLNLSKDDVFEYYKGSVIEKVCYRISYNSTMDIILVLSNTKNIITIYLNGADDKHETLKENLYCRVDK